MGKSLLFFASLPFISIIVLLNQNNSFENPSLIHQTIVKSKVADEPKCSDCHGDMLENKTKHPPAAESCEACHQVNIKEHTEAGAKGLQLSDKLPDLCFTCHDGVKTVVDSAKFLHLALKTEKTCVACHSPHSSAEDKLLRKEEKKLCLSCHNKDKTAKGEKSVNINSLLAKSKVIHPPVEGGCLVCHRPHASDKDYLLIKSFPRGFYASAEKETFALCWECHDSELLKAEKTTTATNFRNGDKNLHFVHVNGEKSRSCVMCHNVHASNNLHLIEDKIAYGQWNLPLKYKAKENGGSCFPGCHAMKEYIR